MTDKKVRPLNAKDHLVLRAARWSWWTAYHSQAKYNRDHINFNQLTFGRWNVYRILASTGLSEGLDEERVGYRLRKLEQRGYLQGHRGHYELTAQTDPYAGTLRSRQEAEQKRQQELQKAGIDMVGIMLDQLLPGHTMSVSAGYSNGKVKRPIAITGSVQHFRMLLKLAEEAINAQEAAAELLHDDN